MIEQVQFISLTDRRGDFNAAISAPYNESIKKFPLKFSYVVTDDDGNIAAVGSVMALSSEIESLFNKAFDEAEHNFKNLFPRGR